MLFSHPVFVRIRARYERMNGQKMTLLAVVGVLMVVGAVVGHGVQTARADKEICRKVDRLDAALVTIVARSVEPLKPGEYGYAYQEAHPEEVRGTGSIRARDAVNDLRVAACEPGSLPSSP